MIKLSNRTLPAILVIGLLLAVFAIAVSFAASKNILQLTIGEHTFNIPDRYLIKQPSWWKQLVPGMDNGDREVLILIPASEVARSVPEFKAKNDDFVDDLQMRLVVLTSAEKKRYLRPDQFIDIWDKTGSYRSVIVKRDSENGFVYVYRKIEYPYSWEVFTITPGERPIPDNIFSFWLGHCLAASSSMTRSGKIINCDSYTIVNNVAVHFRTTSQNLSVIPDLRTYIDSLIKNWEGTPR